MKLYELGTGEPVQVLVKVENASAEYDSTVAFGKEGILLIEPIRYDGKIINFSGDKAVALISFTTTERFALVLSMDNIPSSPRYWRYACLRFHFIPSRLHTIA